MKTLKTVLMMLLCLSLGVGMVACGAANNKETETEAPVSGGWSTGEPTELTDEQKAVFAKATENLTGATYTPVLFLGEQVVAGFNYRFLCRAQGSWLDAPLTWVIVEIYEDLEGNAELTNVTDLTDEQAAQYGVEINADVPEIGGMQIANPFIDCGNLAEAAEIAGFAITVPETVDGHSNKLIQAVAGEMIQVFYTTGDPADEGTEEVLLRKGVGSEDISGDYNEYAEVFAQDVSGVTVEFKGDGERVYLATWTDSDYSYSVSVSDGAALDAMLALVNGLK